MSTRDLAAGVFAPFVFVLVNGQTLPPTMNQTLWDYNEEFLSHPENLANPDEEGSAISLHRKMMHQWADRLFPTGDLNILPQVVRDYHLWSAGHPKSQTAFPSNWTPLGPFETPLKPDGTLNPHSGTGQIHCVAFDPGYGVLNNIMYCGSNYGGLFKSLDAGENWVPLWDQVVGFSTVSDIVVLSSNPNTIIASSGHRTVGTTPRASFGAKMAGIAG